MREQLLKAQVRISGWFDDGAYERFREALDRVCDRHEPIVVEISTLGGDAEIGRRIAEDVRLLRRAGREMWCLGKTTVYSAGVTALAAFDRDHRWLTLDAAMLVHERRLIRDLHLEGSLATVRTETQGLLAEIEAGMGLENQGFDELARGSRLTGAEVAERARNTWYLSAREALDLGLVAGLV